MNRRLLVLLAAFACENQPNTQGAAATSRAIHGSADSVATVVTPPDSVTFEEKWNLGDNPDEPDQSIRTRFVITVKKFRSGLFTLVIDTIPRSGTISAPFVADSVSTRGVEQADRVTKSCMQSPSGTLPIVGLLRDSVYERWGHPQAAWEIDSTRAQVRQISPDSVSCFIPGPD
jgi:hypothetical protein